MPTTSPKGIKVKGTKDDDILSGTALDDKLDGKAGSDLLAGLGGDDRLKGHHGDDTLDGGEGDDRLDGKNGDDALFGRAGDDKLDGKNGDDLLVGGGGSDWIRARNGDDRAVFEARANDGAFDRYEGGNGFDTLVLNLTEGELAAHAADLAAFEAFIAGTLNKKGEAGKDTFTFEKLGLQVNGFEALEVRATRADSVKLGEDGAPDKGGPVPFGSVLDNDLGTASVVAVRVVDGSGPDRGNLIFREGAPGAPDGSFSFDPAGAFETLALRETATVSFDYEVEYADGLTNRSTVTITVEGANDAPIVEAIAGKADEDGSAIALSADFSDVDTSDTHTIAVDTAGTKGLVVENGDGTFSYDANGAFEHLAVGETATDTFSYTVTDNNGASDTATASVTVIGANDAPVADEIGTTADEDGPATTLTAKFADVDLSDTHTFSIDTTGTKGSVVNNGDGTFSYDPNGAFEYLALGETATDTFTYAVTDNHGVSDTATATVTVTGANDTPVAVALAARLGEDDRAVVLNLDADDVDTTDAVRFDIVSDPTDAFGNQYGSVVQTSDGAFEFRPGDAFQFLDAGESRTVTFDYVAIDDSGAANATSDRATVSVTVEGRDDADVTTTGSLVFVTEDQSQFGPGDAVVEDPDIPFIGLWSDAPIPLGTTIFEGRTLEGEFLSGVLNGIESVTNAVGDALEAVGCAAEEVGAFIGGIFGVGDGNADCSDNDIPNVDLPSSITIPSVKTVGSLAYEIGVQPYFSMTSGDVDASLPINASVVAPRQVEAGESFTLSTAYLLDEDAFFETASPNITFGMDFVFDFDVDFGLQFGNHAPISIFDIDTSRDANFRGELGKPGFNILDFSLGDIEPTITLPQPLDFVSVTAGIPVIDTVGAPIPGQNALESTGEDDIVSVDMDVDKLVTTLTGLPPLGYADSEGLTIDVAGQTLNLLSFAYSAELIDVTLNSTLSAIQEFQLDIEELPLVLTLEDDSRIDGVKLGDDISITAPLDFDADIEGDADGLVDFDVEVDLDALFANHTFLAMSVDLTTSLLSLSGGLTSDFISDLPTWAPFADGGLGSTTDDSFYLAETLPFVEDEPLATVIEDDPFELAGFEGNPGTSDLFTGEFDIA